MKKAIFVFLICLQSMMFSMEKTDRKLAIGFEPVSADMMLLAGKTNALLLGINWDVHVKLPIVPLYIYADLTYFLSYLNDKNKLTFYTRFSTDSFFAGRIGGGIDFVKGVQGLLFSFQGGLGITAGYLFNIPSTNVNIFKGASFKCDRDTLCGLRSSSVTTKDGFDVGLRIPIYLGVKPLPFFEIYAGLVSRIGVAILFYNDIDFEFSHLENNKSSANFEFDFQLSVGLRFWIGR